MSTDRFLRLPEEKRNRFLNAAWEEFTTTRFSEASINQIVRKAGIPRGSFYQYFNDKEDLFSYLLDDVRSHVKEIYQDALAETGGDIFAVQMVCFDRLTAQDMGLDPMLARCVRFLRRNQGVDIQKLVPKDQEGRPSQVLLDDLMGDLNLEGFRRKDRMYVQNVMALAMAALGSAFMDSLMYPERRECFREELALRLEIIQCGCCTKAPPAEAEDEKILISS